MARRSALDDLHANNPDAPFDELVIHDFALGSVGYNAAQVAASLGVRQPVVWAAMRRLIARGHLAHPLPGYFTPSRKGWAAANAIDRRGAAKATASNPQPGAA
ncbi:hypothetical protein V5F49_03680 [Xanthobacter sp. V3C-3]|uniref:hypothetical protein n=1 Tax=Xanthobacter lutulentifluminis TaxID=3119935 RepID=UPI00372BABE9